MTRKLEERLGLHLREDLGLRFVVAKQTGLICFERISVMAEGDLKKGFEGFDFTSLFHLDW